MGLFRVVLLCTLFFVINCESDCQKTFEDVRLAPKYFNPGTSGDLKVVYEDKSKAKCGNKVSILSVQKPPVVTYNAKKSCKLMSIIMFDPDVPTPPHLYLHWFVVNIPANVMKKGYRGQAGKEIASYLPPGAPTGDHRYTTCVYYQNEYIRTCKKYNPLNRFGVNPRSLAKKYNLQSPEACNFFYLTAANAPIIDDKPVVRDLESKKKDLGNQDKSIL